MVKFCKPKTIYFCIKKFVCVHTCNRAHTANTTRKPGHVIGQESDLFTSTKRHFYQCKKVHLTV